jgi:hypothetical protein
MASAEIIQIIIATVASLKNLTHLCIRCIRPHEEAPPEACLDMAQRLASANEMLRFVKIGIIAWRISRRSPHGAVLQSLDEWEVKDIEAFDLGWPDYEVFW